MQIIIIAITLSVCDVPVNCVLEVVVNLDNNSASVKLKLREVKQLAETHTAVCEGTGMDHGLSDLETSFYCIM